MNIAIWKIASLAPLTIKSSSTPEKSPQNKSPLCPPYTHSKPHYAQLLAEILKEEDLISSLPRKLDTLKSLIRRHMPLLKILRKACYG